jgi:hypothetical protein
MFVYQNLNFIMLFRKYYLLILIVLFFAFAVVQLNDPDPILWIAIYLTTAFLFFRKINFKKDESLYAVISIIFMLWAINIFPEQWEGVMLNESGMKTLNIELGRESLGLVICSITIFSVFFIDKIIKQ